MTGTASWLVPDWPVAATVRAVSTLRSGGVSDPPFDSLNLGAHVGDAAAAVASNRQRLLAAAGVPSEPCWLDQVHGIRVVNLDAADARGPADAAVTRQPRRVCAVLTADCLPVLLASRSGDRVGAAHAGWRGLAAGVIEAAVGALELPPADMLAWLGPAIGPAHFEVGAEVREAMVDADPGADEAFRMNSRGRHMADLYTLARRRLGRLGMTQVYGGGECTYEAADRFSRIAETAVADARRRSSGSNREATR